MIKNKELYDKIAEALIADYKRIYLVNTGTGEFCRYFVEQEYHLLKEEQKGDEFFRGLTEIAGEIV